MSRLRRVLTQALLREQFGHVGQRHGVCTHQLVHELCLFEDCRRALAAGISKLAMPCTGSSPTRHMVRTRCPASRHTDDGGSHPRADDPAAY